MSSPLRRRGNGLVRRVRDWLAGAPRRIGRDCGFCRPMLEALEDRTVLSNVVVGPAGPMPQYNLPVPAAGDTTGNPIETNSHVVRLPNGNVVVVDAAFNHHAGVVCLYSGAT